MQNRPSTAQKVAAIDRDDVVMRAKDAGQYLGGVPESTLASWRHAGTGPRFAHYGRYVVYRKRWLDEFINRNSATSTREMDRRKKGRG